MLNDRSSPLSLLRTRRSLRPRDLIDPGPAPEELRTILEVAMRVPDHGKLAPWRFVRVSKTARAEFHRLLDAAYREGNPEPGRLELEAHERFAHQAPELLVVLSAPVIPHKIPAWEQELSCGAAIMNLLTAAHALGYAGGWVTGWAAYSETVRRAFGKEGERIAGFVFLGSPACEPEERVRPEYHTRVTHWSPDR